MKTRFGAERRIDAPAAVVYHCLADYREHHRPGGFLPPAFSSNSRSIAAASVPERSTTSSWSSGVADGRSAQRSASRCQDTRSSRQGRELRRRSPFSPDLRRRPRAIRYCHRGGWPPGDPEPFVRRADDRPHLRGRPPAARGPRQGPPADPVVSATTLGRHAGRNSTMRPRSKRWTRCRHITLSAASARRWATSVDVARHWGDEDFPSSTTTTTRCARCLLHASSRGTMSRSGTTTSRTSTRSPSGCATPRRSC